MEMTAIPWESQLTWQPHFFRNHIFLGNRLLNGLLTLTIIFKTCFQVTNHLAVIFVPSGFRPKRLLQSTEGNILEKGLLNALL